MMIFNHLKIFIISFLVLGLTACYYPPLDEDITISDDYTYVIGPGDNLNIVVWGNPEVTTSVPVRPDGRFSIPLVEDVQASGKTPYELARKLEEEFAEYIRDPIVVVIVTGFQGIDAQQIRIIGQIGQGSSGGGGGFGGGFGGGGRGLPRYRGMSIPYERGMTLLDVIIKIGTIGTYADGNRSSIIRKINGIQQQFGVKIDNLVDDGNMQANVLMLPGDILVIPQAFF